MECLVRNEKRRVAIGEMCMQNRIGYDATEISSSSSFFMFKEENIQVGEVEADLMWPFFLFALLQGNKVCLDTCLRITGLIFDYPSSRSHKDRKREGKPRRADMDMFKEMRLTHGLIFSLRGREESGLKGSLQIKPIDYSPGIPSSH